MLNRVLPRLWSVVLTVLFVGFGLAIPGPAIAAGPILLDGFESGDFSQWTSVVGSPVVQSVIPRTGSFAARVTLAGEQAYLSKTVSPKTELFVRTWFRVESQSTPVSLLRFARGGKPALGVGLQTDGRLFLRNSTTGAQEVSGASVTDAEWHVVELHILVAGASGQADLWFDGALLGDVGGVENLGTSAVTEIRLGEDIRNRTEDVLFDDVRAAKAFIPIPDIVDPTMPSGLSADAPTSDRVELSWGASTDNVGVSGYTIYRDGLEIDTTTGTGYTDSTVSASTSYDYTVDAFDAAGNHSPPTDVSAHVDVPDPDLIAPDPPANLIGTPVSPIRVDLSWDPSLSADVSGYAIYRDGHPTPIDTSPNPSFSDSTVEPGSSYDYTVDAFDSSGNHSAVTDPPTHVDVPPDSGPPDPPTGLAAQAVSSHRVDLTWNVPNDDVGVTGYTIYRDGNSIDTSIDPSYSDTTVQPAESYSYTVAAHDAAGGVSERSDPAIVDVPDDTLPSTPTNLVAGPVTFDRVDLTWDPATDDVGVTGYTVYRNGSFLDTTTDTTYTDPTVAPSTTYRYRLDAFDAAGNHSAKTAAVRADTPASPDSTPPSIPQNLHADAVTQSRVDLDWNSSTDDTAVVGYNVLREGSAIDTTSSSDYTDNSVTPGATYHYRVEAFDAIPNTSDPSSELIVHVPSGGGGDPVIMAAGDIACDPADGSFNGGNGTSGSCRQKATSDLLVAEDPDAVLALGDNQYDCGGLQAFQQSYGPSWGRVKSITYPVVGNHEYDSSGRTGPCSSSGNGYFNYFGSRAGQQGEGYYSFDVGSWHLIALNSECSHAGGCSNGSAQENWLDADLAADNSNCTLAYWHQPRYGPVSGQDTGSVDPLWDDLVAAGADIVLSGHVHSYTRFTPLNASGQPSANGIRQFIVGTGGKSVSSPGSRSIVDKGGSDYGVLKLTLHTNSYEWEFVHASGESFTDSGSSSCH